MTGLVLTGRVVRGDGRGAQLGFPTANLSIERAEDLARGVYAARVRGHGEQPLDAVANIGSRPTFADAGWAVELHILDFNEDLYGVSLEVMLLKKLRDERAFSGPDELVAQIRNDIHQARALFKKNRDAVEHSTTEVEGVDND